MAFLGWLSEGSGRLSGWLSGALRRLLASSRLPQVQELPEAPLQAPKEASVDIVLTHIHFWAEKRHFYLHKH